MNILGSDIWWVAHNGIETIYSKFVPIKRYDLNKLFICAFYSFQFSITDQ